MSCGVLRLVSIVEKRIHEKKVSGGLQHRPLRLAVFHLLLGEKNSLGYIDIISFFSFHLQFIHFVRNYPSVYLFICVCMCIGQTDAKVTRQLVGVCSLFLPGVFWKLDSCCQA